MGNSSDSSADRPSGVPGHAPRGAAVESAHTSASSTNASTNLGEPSLPDIIDSILKSYEGDARGHHINRHYLPSRDEIIEIIRLLLRVFYPGYFGHQDLTDENVRYHVGVIVSNLRDKLERQIALSLSYGTECSHSPVSPVSLDGCRGGARRITHAFLERLPRVRSILITDVEAAYEGDPAALNSDEIILAYPGLLATTVYRVAHELYLLEVPLMPRMMTEWAHAKTGCDIHPGAEIGPGFFIDHATGVVVGETSRIGANVKLYQGVTLGAISLPRDGVGRVIRGTKRHPTVEDDVTIYANATVLGGNTVVGRGSVVGGSVFITKSVPPGAQLSLKPPELRINSKVASDAESITDGVPSIDQAVR